MKPQRKEHFPSAGEREKIDWRKGKKNENVPKHCNLRAEREGEKRKQKINRILKEMQDKSRADIEIM